MSLIEKVKILIFSFYNTLIINTNFSKNTFYSGLIY